MCHLHHRDVYGIRSHLAPPALRKHRSPRKVAFSLVRSYFRRSLVAAAVHVRKKISKAHRRLKATTAPPPPAALPSCPTRFRRSRRPSRSHARQTAITRRPPDEDPVARPRAHTSRAPPRSSRCAPTIAHIGRRAASSSFLRSSRPHCRASSPSSCAVALVSGSSAPSTSSSAALSSSRALLHRLPRQRLLHHQQGAAMRSSAEPRLLYEFWLP